MADNLTLDEAKDRFRKLLLLKKNTMVSPKMEQFRGFPATFMGARGGRGAGAKSRGFVSLMVQEAHREKHGYAILREIQNSIKNSVYKLIQDHVNTFNYQGWKFTDSYIESPTQSQFIFKGLKDLRASQNLKGLEGYDRIFIEEASSVSAQSLDDLLGTVLREEGPKIMFAYNPLTNLDPVTDRIWNRFGDSKNGLMVEMRGCAEDNPWWPEGLELLSQELKKDEPDLWLHIFGGQPLAQGEYSIISRVDADAAVARNIEKPKGIVQLGVDVARSKTGDDTVIYKRRGMKIIDRKSWKGQDTMRTAQEALDMIKEDKSITIVVDNTGVGTGVSDRLEQLGAKVFRFNAGGAAQNSDRYGNAKAEMWHEFDIKSADIPDNPQLIYQLTSCQYTHDKKGRRMVESKEEHKKRIGRSPDDADALLLCYYNTQAHTPKYASRSSRGYDHYGY